MGSSSLQSLGKSVLRGLAEIITERKERARAPCPYIFKKQRISNIE
jgi:hypothetical protein